MDIRLMLCEFFEEIEAANASRSRGAPHELASPRTELARLDTCLAPMPTPRREEVLGPRELRTAWLATAALVGLADRAFVTLTGSEEEVRELLWVLVAHGVIPLRRLTVGPVARSDWPRLSRQMGTLGSYVTAHESTEPLAVDVETATGHRSVRVGTPESATVYLALSDDGHVTRNLRPVGTFDRETCTIRAAN